MKCLLLNKTAYTTTFLMTLSIHGAWAQSTAFTYQGRLEEDGVPANGAYDARFLLFDDDLAGAQVGSTVCHDVEIVNGLFSVELDFGQQFATPEDRYLALAIRPDEGLDCNNTANFLELLPRQRITPAPMAAHANSSFALDAPDGSPTNAVFVDNTGNVGIGTTSPLSRLHIKGMEEGISIDGPLAGAANLAYISFRTSSGISTGYVGDGSNGDNNTFLASDFGDVILHTSAGRAFSVKANGQVGVGTTAPAAKLDVRGDIKLGPTGQFFATAGEENLRIIRGSVFSNGNSSLGAGFSSVRTGLGQYSITFNPPFTGRPVVTASVTLPIIDFFASIESLSPSQANVFIVNPTPDGSIFADGAFHFIAVGPR